jgi:hypothetical protein
MNTKETVDLYLSKLEANGVSKESCNLLSDRYGAALMIASYATSNQTDLSGDGTLLEVSLKKLAKYGVLINNLYPEDLRLPTRQVVKILLLQHISKAVRLEKNSNEWRAKNLGEAYCFIKNMPAIGIGLHSLAIAVECGIQFTATEVEAMTIIDKADDDLQAKFHSSMLSSIVKQANEMVYTEANKKAKLIV